MQMYPGWSARDNYAIHKKRKRKKPKQGTPEKEEDSGELGEQGMHPLGYCALTCICSQCYRQVKE